MTTLDPAHIWNDIAIAMSKNGNFVAGAAAAGRAAFMANKNDPQYAHIQCNYGNILRRCGRMAEAARFIDKALQLAPNDPVILANQGCLMMDHCAWGPAIALFDKALTEKPDDTKTRFSRSACLMAAGQFEEGFKEYESRFKIDEVGRSKEKMEVDAQLWKGEDLKGKSIAIFCEQGFGDDIAFARFIRGLAALKKPTAISLVVPVQLYNLFNGLFDMNTPDLAINLYRFNDALPKSDYFVWIMSIPGLLSIQNMASPRIFKTPMAAKINRAPGAKLAVGIIWKSKADSKGRQVDEEWHGKQKSIPLDYLIDLASLPGIDLFSLQYGGADDIKQLGAEPVLTDLSPRMLDFADTAELMQSLDVIVSVDTATAHLAGALGRPGIVLLHYSSSWQWLRDWEQTDPVSSWYPSLKLLRQHAPGDWSQPIVKLKTMLWKMAN